MYYHRIEMIRAFVLTVALLVSAGGLLEGQDRSRQARGRDPGPIHTLLELGSELDLSPAQIAQLEGIDAEMDSLNVPLVARMRQIRRSIRTLGPRDELTSEQQLVFEERVAEARPVMDEIDRNNRAAMRRVGEILSNAQKDQIATLLSERAEERERSRRSPRNPGRQD